MVGSIVSCQRLIDVSADVIPLANQNALQLARGVAGQ
jgi:hypothetical protein